MNIIVLTPEKELFKGSINSVKVPGMNGQFEVLKGHSAIVSSLRKGEVRIYDDANNTIKINIEKGFIEVLNNEISLLIQGATMQE